MEKMIEGTHMGPELINDLKRRHIFVGGFRDRNLYVCAVIKNE